MALLRTIVLLCVGGSLGTLARYGLSGLAYRWFGDRFAWGTLAVNLAGAFCIGVGAALAERALLPPGARLLVLVGFLGAFTTFSTYMLETVTLSSGGWWLGALNVVGSTAAGLALVLLGLAAGRAMAG